MSNVMPFRRVVAREQCDRVSAAEDLIVAQATLWAAWARVVTRIWWGA